MLIACSRLTDTETKHLHVDLISADSSMRRSTLAILASTMADTHEDDIDGTKPSAIWTACLQVESSEMTLKNVRERTSNISRLARLLAGLPKDIPEDIKSAVDGAISYLVGQLKVNFRPLYPEITTSLATLVGRHGERIWGKIWSELERTNAARDVQKADLGVELPEWTHVDNNHSKRDAEDDEEAEGEFRCRSLEKSVSVVGKAWLESSDINQVDAKEVVVGL
jgi:U3 small nucleolar RNA-associated protein 20